MRQLQRDRVWLRAARDIAELATCDRLHVGAVILSPDKKIVSTGYNGAPPNRPHCDEVGHRLVNGRCLRTVHTETNAIQQAQEARRSTR